MKRIDALQDFNKTHVKGKNLEKLLALDEYFHKHKDGLASDFMESFRQICLKIKEMQARKTKGKIGYITYSMLRTAILEGKHTFLVEAFNEEWFLDFEECQAEYDASWAFRFLDELGAELEEKRKLYYGAIAVPDIDKIKLAEAIKYNEYVKSLARYALPKAMELKEYREIEKEEELEIRVGEYRDLSEVVYKEDMREKGPEEIKEWLEEKSEDAYTCEVFRSLDLSEGNYEDADLSYADFSKSRLSKSNMTGCVLVGTKFTGGFLEEADLSGSLIHGADFSHCSLKGAIFYEVEGAAGIADKSRWEMPGFMGVSFEGADLEGAVFEDADLKGADFTGANLTNVNFRRADLENAIFSAQDVDKLHLDEKQRKTIQWKR